jgi:hypothetical protein
MEGTLGPDSEMGNPLGWGRGDGIVDYGMWIMGYGMGHSHWHWIKEESIKRVPFLDPMP